MNSEYKLYYNNFWQGFDNGRDPLSLPFFINLFSNVFKSKITTTTDISNTDILLETIGYEGTSLVEKYNWKYKILFSGESRLIPEYDKFDCIIWGEPTNHKIVCCPLFIPYLISSGTLKQLIYMDRNRFINKPKIPPYKKILVVISNPNSTYRNYVLNILERNFLVDYAGRYRTNRPIITAPYYTNEFWNEVSKYRCVLCMENSKGTDYLTEKITHGMMAGTIPIYWGATNVNMYFNQRRFVHINELSDNEINRAVNQIKEIMDNDDYYLRIIQEPIFIGDIDGEVMIDYHMNRIVNEIRDVLHIENEII